MKSTQTTYILRNIFEFHRKVMKFECKPITSAATAAVACRRRGHYFFLPPLGNRVVHQVVVFNE